MSLFNFRNLVTKETYEALTAFTLNGIRKIDLGRMSRSDITYLIDCLKPTPDSPESFPRGKWATIQRLEQIRDEGE